MRAYTASVGACAYVRWRERTSALPPPPPVFAAALPEGTLGPEGTTGGGWGSGGRRPRRRPHFRHYSPEEEGEDQGAACGNPGGGNGRKARRHRRRKRHEEGCLVFIGLNGSGVPQLDQLLGALGQDEDLDSLKGTVKRDRVVACLFHQFRLFNVWGIVLKRATSEFRILIIF